MSFPSLNNATVFSSRRSPAMGRGGMVATSQPLAVAALSLERIHKDIGEINLPPRHPHTITVPGACAGWCDLLDQHGSLTMADVLAPAIRLAEPAFSFSACCEIS